MNSYLGRGAAYGALVDRKRGRNSCGPVRVDEIVAETLAADPQFQRVNRAMPRTTLTTTRSGTTTSTP